MSADYFAERIADSLVDLVREAGDANEIAREQNALLKRIALAAEESARNNPLRQINDILAATAPEETIGR
jgi:hypothetical protein